MPARSPISGKLRPGIQDLPGAFLGGLRSAADALNRAGIGITRKAQAASNTTPFERAQVGTPFVKDGVLGYKGADGQWHQRGDNDAGPESFFKPGIVTGLDPAGNVDRTQSDLYRQYAPKPFPMTQEGQYDRYFKTPEFDYVFGAQTGKGPKTAAEMVTLGTQRQAPTTAPLADYYRAQSATGRVNQAAIQEMYKDRPDLQKWAAANPMLAQREYTKKYGTTDITKLASDQETVMGDLGSRFQDENPYKNTPEAFGLPANPVPPTEQRGAEGMTQGQRMDYFRGVENLVPRQAEFTSGAGAPQLQTTFENLLNKAKKT